MRKGVKYVEAKNVDVENQKEGKMGKKGIEKGSREDCRKGRNEKEVKDGRKKRDGVIYGSEECIQMQKTWKQEK